MYTRDVKLSFPKNNIKKFTCFIFTLYVTILTSFQNNDPDIIKCNGLVNHNQTWTFHTQKKIHISHLPFSVSGNAMTFLLTFSLNIWGQVVDLLITDVKRGCNKKTHKPEKEWGGGGGGGGGSKAKKERKKEGGAYCWFGCFTRNNGGIMELGVS